MRRLTTLIVGLLLFTAIGWGQDTIRSLIISEVQFDSWRNAYVELTNMGTEAVDLEEFSYACIRIQYEFEKIGDEIVQTSDNGFPGDAHTMELSGILQPGESYFIMAVEDVYNGQQDRNVHSIDLVTRVADTVVHRPDWQGGADKFKSWPYRPEWEQHGFDSINYSRSGTINYDIFMARNNLEAAGLYWHSGDTISVLVDQALLFLEDGNRKNNHDIPVAGVPDAADEYVLVRKFFVKEGETDWTKMAGIDEETSQWMLSPQLNGLDPMGKTTEGNHGYYIIDVDSDIYDIDSTDKNNRVLTVPWGTQNMDSIRLGLELGDGMSWWYYENDSFEDSLSNVCQDGDTLELYAFNNKRQVEQYVIKVSDPTDDMVKVFAKHAVNYPPDPDDEDYEPWMVKLVGGVPYVVKEYDGIIDSICDIAYATKVDSMMNLLEIAPNASYEIVWASGEPSNEVSDGDILRITGGDGTTTNDYYLQVEDYMMSDNVNLKAITWPDKPEHIFWDHQDTIPGFINTGVTYTITLPPGSSNIPALRAETEDLNATLTVTRAISLSGGIDQRTTTFHIQSESDTTFRDVKVLFNVEVDESMRQKFTGHPIFSKFNMRLWWSGGAMEVCNPTDELIDFSNYLIVRGWNDITSPVDALTLWNTTDSTAWTRRYMKYVPGYKFQKFDQWQLKPGLLELDPAISPYVEPKDVMVFWMPRNSYASWERTDEWMIPRADVIMGSDRRLPTDEAYAENYPTGINIFAGYDYWNPWNEPLGTSGQRCEENIAMPIFPVKGQSPRSCYYLFYIKEGPTRDSIKSGKKDIYDPEDFEIVDIFGSAEVGPWQISDSIEYDWGKGLNTKGEPNTLGQVGTAINEYAARRDPSVYKGVTNLGEGLEWWDGYRHNEKDVRPEADRVVNPSHYGQHHLNPITEHVSTVSSLVYLVDVGFEGDLGITGIGGGEDVTAFIAGLILADTAQDLTVYDGSNGTARADDAAVVEGDSLVVISPNGDNSTTYSLSTTPLDDNADLVAKDGSGLDVTITDPTGTVSGFLFGATIKSILDGLEVPSLAVLNVVDGEDQLIPLQQLNNDTLDVDVIATNDIYFEVVAQNGKVILYQLTPESANDTAYVLSNVYDVTQMPAKVIAQIEGGTAVQSFFNNLIPVEGATMVVKKISGQVRDIGTLSIDDRLYVTSQDGSKTVVYDLNFIGEQTAFVTSESFTVNQVDYVITVDENTSVEDLIAGLTPSTDATFAVNDADGNAKTTGTVENTDVVVVVSGDGLNEVTYTIDVLLAVYGVIADELKVYPNPTRDILFIENAPIGSMIRLVDLSGRTMRYMESDELNGALNVSDLNSGFYFLTVEKFGRNLQTVKIVKE